MQRVHSCQPAHIPLPTLPSRTQVSTLSFYLAQVTGREGTHPPSSPSYLCHPAPLLRVFPNIHFATLRDWPLHTDLYLLVPPEGPPAPTVAAAGTEHDQGGAAGPPVQQRRRALPRHGRPPGQQVHNTGACADHAQQLDASPRALAPQHPHPLQSLLLLQHTPFQNINALPPPHELHPRTAASLRSIARLTHLKVGLRGKPVFATLALAAMQLCLLSGRCLLSGCCVCCLAVACFQAAVLASACGHRLPSMPTNCSNIGLARRLQASVLLCVCKCVCSFVCHSLPHPRLAPPPKLRNVWVLFFAALLLPLVQVVPLRLACVHVIPYCPSPQALLQPCHFQALLQPCIIPRSPSPSSTSPARCISVSCATSLLPTCQT